MAGISVNNNPISVSDDWRRNWQESIAVRISALVLWVTVPVVVLLTLVYLQNATQTLKKEYAERADLLAFRIGSAFTNIPNIKNPQFRDEAALLARDLGFSGLRVSAGPDELLVGGPVADLQAILRGVPAALPSGAGTMNMILVTGYHLPFDVMLREKREDTLMSIVLGSLAFGVFMMWSIRTIVHKPLQALVNATRTVSEGNKELRLDTARADEFGYLARFFNEMLDRFMDQQKKVEEALAEAEQANRAKSVFLANMSHELRTPLNAIIGYSDMLVDEAGDNHQLQHVPDLERIKTAGKHLLDLISNILDISKIEAGKMELYIETFNIDSMILDIVATVQSLVDKNKNRLDIDCPTDIGSIRCDVTKLRQALVNLLGNAAKFTEHGLLTLRIRRTNVEGEEKLSFVVGDTGIGMSPAQLEGVFQSFAQGDASITRKYGGTGLGLAISRHYIKMMGGEISVESVPGVGTTFTIQLPARVEPDNRSGGQAERQTHSAAA